MSELLAEFYTESELAQVLGRHRRTIERFTRQSNNPLPYLKLGNQRLFNKETTANWLRSLERIANPPRRRRDRASREKRPGA